LGGRTCNREVAGSSPGRSAARNNSGQVVHTSVVVFETMVLVSSGLEAKSAGLGLGLGLGLAFKQDQDLINFDCAISATKL